MTEHLSLTHSWQACLCAYCSVMSSSCNPKDCSLPGSSVHGISQARILEWVAISSSWRSFQPRDQTIISCVSALEAESLTAEPPGKPLLQDYILPKTKQKWLLGCILEIFLNASPLENNENKLIGSSYSNPILAIALERFTRDYAHALTNMGNSPY